jgi:xanthine dehydrogenase accessory factor
VKLELLEKLLAARRAGAPTALATDLATGAQSLVDAGTAEGELVLDAEALAQARQAIADDASRTIEAAAARIFVEIWNPPLRMIIVGAVHIAQALAPMAALGGWGVTIIDPRAAFASAERFPGVALATDWPDEVMPGLKPDRRTAIVTLTHDPKIDDPALQAALRSEAFYIGSLGSRRTHAKRCDRLAGAGFAADQIARIHGPVGLAIGALTPAEIAISILAEVTAVLRRADRKGEPA